MSFFDLLKWLFEILGINKKNTTYLIVAIVLLNVGLYYCDSLIKSLVSHSLILKILIHIFLSIFIVSLVGNMVFLLSKPMLKVKLGVYWDNQFNPYCPKCKIPLTGSHVGSNVLHCAECRNDFYLRYGKELLALDEAINKIKKIEV